ncbi:MAG: MFS transporter [Actinomycetota bacterium]
MPRATPPEAAQPLLERLGLHRRELRAWALYDWATTGLYVVIVTAVFPVYYQTVAADGLAPAIASQRYALATTLGIVLVALPAPFIGALTDQTPAKKRLLASFMLLGVGATSALFYVERGDWRLALGMFVLVNIGVNGSTIFYDALLPHVAGSDEVDQVSAGASAVGYVGATILLLASVVVIEFPGLLGIDEGTLPARITFLATALWWLLFTLPLLRVVPEPRPRIVPGERGSAARRALARLGATLRDLRSYRQAFLLMLAYLVYGDGVGTIIRLATVYGAEIGIGQTALLGAVVVVQVVGIPATFAFGALAGVIGAKRCILLALTVYGGVTIVAYFMTSATEFFVLAFCVGLVQGGTQALSRSLFASMIPRYKSGELFGFYGVMDKFAGMMGPAVFAGVISLTGSSRQGILSVLGFFAVGAALLWFVDEGEGRRVAQRAQAQAMSAEEAGQG